MSSSTLLGLIILGCINTSAQQLDTTRIHNLGEVLILENKQKSIETSKKSIEIDSLVMARYSTSSLAEVLASQSTIHIKAYGNGNIASASMRGGNANHTAILWNGFNIQNPRLGMTDLSMVPTILFENASIEYGGGSAMWGSGAIGGSVHLQNKVPFNRGFETKVQMSKGSFNTNKIATSILFSNRRLASNTKIYYNSSLNNYTYKDTTDKEEPLKHMSHTNYYVGGLLQEFSIWATQNQKINVKAWYNKANRNLSNLPSKISGKNQKDENIKLAGDWNYSKGKLNAIVRSAFFKDLIDYTDTLSHIKSKNYANTFITESDNSYLSGNHTFNFGTNYTYYKSYSEFTNDTGDVTSSHDLQKIAFFAAYKLSMLNSKLNYNIAIRKEFTSLTPIPFTGNTGIKYQLFKFLALKINASESYRQPSLDDLYWPGAGNRNLKPEESYEVDGGFEIKLSKSNFSLVCDANYFNRHTTNWIIWLPTSTSSNWTPLNIAEVYSRGTDTRTELSYTKKDFQIKLIATTAYVLATNTKSKSENDNSIGRQLIYTPRYNGQASLLIKYKYGSLLFNNNYTGYRFTSTDNTQWLNPYYIANIKASYNYSFSTVNMELFGSVNNLFNKNYVVVRNNPMPLRNYEFGLILKYYKKPKEK